MIVAESIIAKAVGTLIARASSSLIGLATSKRRKACRYLVKLYYAIEALDASTARILIASEEIVENQDSNALFHALISEQDSLEYASNAFIDLSRDMQRGLAILDPALHQMCRVIYRGKADFLRAMSSDMRIDYNSNPPCFEFWIPTQRLLDTDFDAAYKDSMETIKRGEEYYWPSGAFDYFGETEKLILTAESKESAEKLLAMIRNHYAELTAAREKLRLLIKESFSLEEILFHRDDTPELSTRSGA